MYLHIHVCACYMCIEKIENNIYYVINIAFMNGGGWGKWFKRKGEREQENQVGIAAKEVTGQKYVLIY